MNPFLRSGLWMAGLGACVFLQAVTTFAQPLEDFIFENFDLRDYDFAAPYYEEEFGPFLTCLYFPEDGGLVVHPGSGVTPFKGEYLCLSVCAQFVEGHADTVLSAERFLCAVRDGDSEEAVDAVIDHVEDSAENAVELADAIFDASLVGIYWNAFFD